MSQQPDMFHQTMRQMEVALLTQTFEVTLKSSKEFNQAHGRGALTYRVGVDPRQAKFGWTKEDDLPHDEIRKLCGQSDVGKGKLLVVMVNPYRIAAYLLDTSIGFGARQFLDAPFAIIGEREIKGDAPPPGRLGGQIFRPADLEDDDEFL